MDNKMATIKETENLITAREEGQKVSKQIKEVYDFLLKEANNKAATRFIETIRIALDTYPTEEEKKEETPRLEKMTPKEERIFEQTPLPYGKYKGKTILQIYELDQNYLHWLSGQKNYLINQLNRYLLAQDE